jgi:hypothetical protein
VQLHAAAEVEPQFHMRARRPQRPQIDESCPVRGLRCLRDQRSIRLAPQPHSPWTKLLLLIPSRSQNAIAVNPNFNLMLLVRHARNKASLKLHVRSSEPSDRG